MRGAWRVGDTVRRTTGPWTPAVHDLLGHLRPRLPTYRRRSVSTSAYVRCSPSWPPGTTHDRQTDLLEFVGSARELLRSG